MDAKIILGGLALVALAGERAPDPQRPPPRGQDFSNLGLVGNMPSQTRGPESDPTIEAQTQTSDRQRGGAFQGQLIPRVASITPASSSGQQANKSAPGQQSAIQSAIANGEFFQIENWGDLRTTASLLAGAAVVQKGAKQKVLTGALRTTLASARQRMKICPVFVEQFETELANRLYQLGSISTNGWEPRNAGTLGPSENKYTVPTKTKAELRRELAKFDAIDFAFELAVAEATSAAIGQARGDTNAVKRVVDGLGKFAAKVASRTTQGLTKGGPWGALVGAIEGAVESAFSQAFDGLVEASQKKNKENVVFAEVLRSLGEVGQIIGGIKYPLVEMGYAMDIPNPQIPRDIEIGAPISLFVQRAGQENLAGAIFSFGAVPDRIPQGVYPGPGLWAYEPVFGRVPYTFTFDGADDITSADWTRAPGGPSAKKVP